jgi:hypothetical protein
MSADRIEQSATMARLSQSDSMTNPHHERKRRYIAYSALMDHARKSKGSGGLICHCGPVMMSSQYLPPPTADRVWREIRSIERTLHFP